MVRHCDLGKMVLGQLTVKLGSLGNDSVLS